MPILTRAAILRTLGEPLEIVQLELGDPGEGQVVVQMHYSGVCHSQLHEARGRRGPDRFLPHTLGHEGSGVVVAVGRGVTKVAPGDAVVLTWIKGDGYDVPSHRYTNRANGETVNSGAISTFANHTIVSENRLVPLPPGTPLDVAALLGCALPTGAGVVLNQCDVQGDSSIAVFGAGGVGCSAIIGAVLEGAGQIIAIDIHDEKLAFARSLGATHTINGRGVDVPAAIRELTGGRGVQVSIEAAGTPLTMQDAFASARDGDGICVIAGNLPAGTRIEIDPFMLIRGRKLLGSWGGATQPDADIPKLRSRLHEAGCDERARSLITRTYRLEDVNEALSDLEQGGLCRGLIRLDAALDAGI